MINLIYCIYDVGTNVHKCLELFFEHFLNITIILKHNYI